MVLNHSSDQRPIRAPRQVLTGVLAPMLGSLLLAACAVGVGVPITVWPQTSPQPQAPPASPLDQQMLLLQLAEADLQWTPRAEPLANGGYRYVYKRRAGEPQLDLAGVRALIANPPSYGSERQAIGQLLEVLQMAGVRVSIAATRLGGAAAEWDPRARSLRIQPTVVEKGTLEFARVLNHEAIHVAQSCSNKGLGSEPLPLGLPTRLPGHLVSVLNDPIYRTAPERVRQLEREAFANQDRLNLGAQLVQAHCRGPQAAG